MSARLTCSSWAQALPLPQITLSLTATASGLSTHAGRKLQNLLQAMQDSQHALGPVRQLVLSLTPVSSVTNSSGHASDTQSPPHAGPESRPAVDSYHHQQQQHHVQSQPHIKKSMAASAQQAEPSTASETTLSLLSKVLASLPALDSISISISKPQQPSSVVLQQAAILAGAAALLRQPTVQDCHAVLWHVLALPQLQQQLRVLSITCEGLWPSHQRLAAALVQLKSLSTLQLHSCPLSSLTRLPALPQLQHLSVSGRQFEPVPRSYSVRQLPLLPSLPRLQSLQLLQLPQDVQWQELHDITAAQHTAQRHSTAAAATTGVQGTAVDSRLSSSVATAAAVANQRQLPHQQQQELSTVSDWRSVQQWVSSSIMQQCPNLRRLRSDMVLGAAVMQLQHLVSLTAPHTAAACSGVCCPRTTAHCQSLSKAEGQAAAHASAAGSSTAAAASRVQGRHSVAAAAVAAARQDAAWRCCQHQVVCSCSS